MSEGLIHSLIIFLLSLYMVTKNPLLPNGVNPDFWAFSNTLFTSIIMIANIRVFLLVWKMPILTMVAIGFSVIIYWVYAFASAEFSYSKTRYSY